MNFDFSDDQKMLKEQVRKFLADKCPMSVTRRVLDGDEPYAKEVWKGLVEMGLTGTAIPEEFGGLGLGALELCVIAEELGRAAAPVPFSSRSILPPRRSSSSARRSRSRPGCRNSPAAKSSARSPSPKARTPPIRATSKRNSPAARSAA